MAREITVELLTPLFIGGADTRGDPKPEGLRPPSLRGAVRFWFRAGAGLPLASLHKREIELFGATQPKPFSSPVSLKTGPLTELQSQEWWQRPHGASASQQPYLRSLQQQYPGVAYLAFSAREERDKPPRISIQPGARFQIVLRQTHQVEDALRSWEASLWLWCHLGGLGARARRGFGSFWPVDAGSESSARFLFQGRTLEDLRDFLKQGIDWAINVLRQTSTAPASDYNVLAKDRAKVFVATPKEGQWRGWEEALNQFGLRLRDARRASRPNLADVEQFLEHRRALPSLDRASFGLPIIYYKPGFHATLSVTDPQQPDAEGRRASPLLVKVARLGANSYALVLTTFLSQFLGKGRALTVKGRDKDREIADQPSLQPLGSFVRSLGSSVGPPGRAKQVPLAPLQVLEVPLP